MTHRERLTTAGGVPRPAWRVLTNVANDVANPWLASWREAEVRAGVRCSPLKWRSVLAVADRPQAVHLQWPERAASPVRLRGALRRTGELLLQVAYLRATGRKVLLTMHNARGHESPHPRLEGVLWTTLTRLVTDVHTFADASRAEIINVHRALARKRWHTIPHGDYCDSTPTGDAAAARRRLALPEGRSLLMTFGQLRPYKGTIALIEAFASRPTRDGTVLVVAGATRTPDDEARLVAAAGGSPDVVLDIRFQSPQELADLLAASDLVVLPYVRVLTSGSAMLALTAGRPVLVPATAWFEDLATRVGPGWVTTYSGDLDAEVLTAALALSPPPRPPDLAWADWTAVETQIAHLWRTVLGR